MGLVRRMFAAALIAAIALLSLAATASAGNPDNTYQRYAIVRDQVRACVLDRTYRHLGQEKRRTCRSYRRLYGLASPGGSSDVFLVCFTRRCPTAPPGVPNPRGRVPADFKVDRI